MLFAPSLGACALESFYPGRKDATRGRYTLKSEPKALIRSDGAGHTSERNPCRRVSSVSYVRRGQHSYFVDKDTAWYRSGATPTSEKNCSTKLRPNLVTAHSSCPTSTSKLALIQAILHTSFAKRRI